MNNQQPNYWCHQCNCRVKAISSLEDGEPICPICKDSFVELLEESQNSNNNNNSSSTQNQVINMDDMLDSALEGIFQQQQQGAHQTPDLVEANTASDDDEEGDEGDMDLETANAFLDAILSNRQRQQTPNNNNNTNNNNSQQQQQPIPDLLTLMNQMFGTGVGLGLGGRNNNNNNNNNMNVNNNDGQQDPNVQQQQQANAQNNNPMDFFNTLVNNLGVALGGGAANTNMNATTGGTANPTNVFSFNLNDVFNQINTGGAQLGDYFLGDNLQQLINHLFDHSGSSGPPPASKRAMDSLPIQKATSEFHDKECTICQDHYQDDEEIVTLPCSHVFHKDCLWPWLNRHGTCPTCRFKLETTEEAPNPDAINPNQQTDNNNTNINNNMNANLGAGPMNPFANLFNFAGMPPPNNTNNNNGGPQVFQFSFPFGNPNPNVNNDNNRDNNNTNNNNNNNNNNGSGGNMSYFL